MKKAVLLGLVLLSVPWGAFGQNPFNDSSAASVSPEAAQTSSYKIPGIVPLSAATGAESSNAGRYAGVSLNRIFAEIKNPTSGSLARVRHIFANADAWYCRWRMLEQAQRTIDCTYYIVDKDIFGQAFLGMLVRKARQGVKIRLMIDGRIYRSAYMKGMPDRFEELARFPNVQIKLYNSVLKSIVRAITDFRGLFASNHDKIILVDDRLSIIGGRNIGPDYYADKGEYPIVYRDSDVVMEGNHIARALKEAFDSEWALKRNSVVKPDLINMKNQMARLEIAALVMDRYLRGWLIDPKRVKWTADQKEILTELNHEITKYKNLCSFSEYQIWKTDAKLPVKIIDKHSSLGERSDIQNCLLAFIEGSRQEIIIQNPYVVLTKEAYAALKRASARGVKIIFHTNSGASTDSLFPQAFLWNDWMKMLADMPTCRIFVAPSENERLHAKVFVFDQRLTIVGSYNMDPLSQDSNSEVVAAVYDREFARITLEQIQKDMAVVLEYKIHIDANGRITRAFGPEDHLDEKILKKMNFFRKLKFIRPVI